LSHPPTSSFDPIRESLILTNPRGSNGDPLRIRARDVFFLDLLAVRHGIEKTNLNTGHLEETTPGARGIF
jgi:hypothetical protein